MVLAAGSPAPEITCNQPVVARDERKRLLELSVAEAGPAFVEAGLITPDELDRTLTEMRRLNADSTVVAVMPRLAQVWARKPALLDRGLLEADPLQTGPERGRVGRARFSASPSARSRVSPARRIGRPALPRTRAGPTPAGLG